VTDLPAGMAEPQLQSILGKYGTIKSCKCMPGSGKNAARITFADLDDAKWFRENLDGNIPEGLSAPVKVRYSNSADMSSGGGGGGWGKAGGDGGKGGGNRWSPWEGGKAAGNQGPGLQWNSWQDGKGAGKSGLDSIETLKRGLRAAGAIPGGKWANDSNCIFVGSLPEDTTDTDLYEIFTPFGPIASQGVRAMQTPEGICKGIGFINFLDSESTQKAIMTLNGTMMPSGRVLKVCPKGDPKPKKENVD